MKIFNALIIIFLCAFLFLGCGEDSEEIQNPIEKGSIKGKVTDSEFGFPIEGASVSIKGQSVITDKDGNYSTESIDFSDDLDVLISANDYQEYRGKISLRQEILIFNISLSKTISSGSQVINTLEALSRDIEALDPEKISSIQGRIAKDYVPGDDAATAFGVFVGVIPPSYEGTPKAIETIIGKYDKIKFTFAEPNVTFQGSDVALVEMRFEIYAETKANPPNPAKKWEIAINGKLKLRKESEDWKIILWQLVEPFLKFEEKPL